MEELITRKQAAQMLRLSTQTISKMTKAGILKEHSRELNNKVLYLKSDIEEYLRTREVV